MVDQRLCGCCGGSEFQHKWEKVGYHIGKCTTCGLIQVMENLTDEKLREIYSQGFFEGASQNVYPDYASAPAIKIRQFGERLDAVTAEHGIRDPGTFLEIGCAHGFCLAAARERGWEVRGIEISSHAAQWGREHLDLDISDDPSELEKLPPQSQSLVIMWDVIEHLRDPKQVLLGIRRCLRPDGVLVFATGDVGSHGARFYGRRWFLINPPYHLFYFDHSSVTRLLECTGFRVRKIRNGGGHPLEQWGRGSKILGWIAKHDRWIGWRLGPRAGPIMEVSAGPALGDG